MQTIFNQIAAERSRQDTKHGGPEHDDAHNPSEWGMFILDRVQPDPAETWRQRMVEIAALAVAAIESHDRKNPPPIVHGDFMCPRCEGLPFFTGRSPTPHTWKPVAGWPTSQGPAPSTCTGCGSLKPDDVLRLMRAGWRDEPTDKGYKGYLNAPPGQSIGSGPGKFYIHHFTPAQVAELVDLATAARKPAKP